MSKLFLGVWGRSPHGGKNSYCRQPARFLAGVCRKVAEAGKNWLKQAKVTARLPATRQKLLPKQRKLARTPLYELNEYGMTQQWIGIREASALTQKPERTLRYQAAQGKIEGKKEGQNWLIELNSLKSSGLIKVAIVPPPPPPRFAQ